MRKTAAPRWLGALAAGLVLVAGLAVSGATYAQTATGAWLGVYTQDLTPELRDGMDYQGTGGVLVNRVVPDSPADVAGIEKGDVLLSFDGRTIDSATELQESVRAARVSQSVPLVVLRDGARKSLTAKLAARPSAGEMERMAPVPPQEDVEPGPGRGPKDLDIQIEGLDPKDLKELHGLEGLQGLEGLRDLDLTRIGAAGRGRLGVRIETLGSDLGSYFNLPQGGGALVLEVMKDTPAEKAGLKPGDVIVKVDDRAVASAEDLMSALKGKDGQVTLRVVRKGGTRTFSAVLEKASAQREMGWLGDTPATPGQRRVRVFRRNSEGMGSGPGGGVEKRVRVYVRDKENAGDQQDLRRELDDLRQQLDELQRRLDDKGNR